MGKRRILRPLEKTRCRFCRSRMWILDYKDLASLQKLVTSQGRMFSRKRSGNCARHQHQAKLAVRYARFLALLPYVGE